MTEKRSGEEHEKTKIILFHKLKPEYQQPRYCLVKGGTRLTLRLNCPHCTVLKRRAMVGRVGGQKEGLPLRSGNLDFIWRRQDLW